MNIKPKSAEILPGPGFRIKQKINRLVSIKLDRLQFFESALISDQLNRLYTLNGDIQNITFPEKKIVGAACTVKVFPGDNLMVHKALDLVKPGDIIVIDSNYSLNTAMIGDLIANKAMHRGVKGFVIDGMVRDLEGIKKTGLPVFAKGTTPNGPLHRGPGEINYPIQCGGVVVNPGDIIVGDEDGVVSVPLKFLPKLVRQLKLKQNDEKKYRENVINGIFSNDWVDLILEINSCQIENDVKQK